MLYVLGNACRDITFRVDDLPAPGETLNARSVQAGLGGKGLNQAIAAARTGADVCLIAAVGSDMAAAAIRDTLQSERIAANTLIELPGETDLSVIVVASGGENFIVTNASLAESVTAAEIEGRMSFTKDDILLLQGNLLPEPSLHAARRAKEAHAKVIFNPAPYRDWCRKLDGIVDVLILNAVEAARWTGIEDLERAIGQVGAPLVIVTRGRDGCLLKDGSGAVRQFPAPRSASEDTSGAGDVFVGVFAAEWSQMGDATKAVKLAVLAAGDSVTRRGTLDSIPKREKIIQLRDDLT
jgi:ribokinase